MNRRFAAGILCGILSLTLCSCARTPSADTDAVIVLPEPAAEPVNMILGEKIAAEPENVVLYYVSGDGTSFTTVTRSMILAPGENIYEEAVNVLIGTSGSPEHTALFPKEVRLLDVEYARGIVTVNLSLDAHSVQSEQEYMMMLASVTNTLLSLDDVQAVNVLVNGRSESVSSLPVGVQNEAYTGITPAYAQISAERDYFLESSTGTILREAALYFPAQDATWFVPELRQISFDSDNYASALIRALRVGPTEITCCASAIPEGADLLVNNPKMEVTSAGERVLNLEFSSTLLNYLAFSGLEEWQLIGSLTLTICSFAPEVDAVRIYIDDRMVTNYVIDDRNFEAVDGLHRRSDFSAFVGDTMPVYVPTQSGTLERVERAGSMMHTQSPQSRLYALIDYVLSQENEETSLFPEGVYYDDILGISVEDGIALVNLSANFYQQCQALDATEERGVVYAFVNTLCELDEISGVRFYIEGISAETLSGSIYLKSILLPNPGMIADGHSAVPEFTTQP